MTIFLPWLSGCAGVAIFQPMMLRLLAWFGCAAPKHLVEPVADRVCPRLVGRFIRPQLPPCNPCQALPDLVLVKLLRLPPCGGA